MASTSSSSSRPNQTRTTTYDVFLSFRGEDTRYTFTDNLYQALLRAGVRTFRDDDAIPRGEVLQPNIETAINESKGSIAVLSSNYADSTWCLDELWLILEQRRKCGHFVIPIFYQVDPSHVRKQTGSFAVKSVEAKEGSKWTEDNVTRWKAALKEVADLTGEVFKGEIYETKFIKKVVKSVKRKLNLNLVISTPDHLDLVGMDTRIEDIINSLWNEQYNAIAICGMGGLGKSTIAHNIYDSYNNSFESSSFVEKIGENYKHGLLNLQQQLLKDLSWNMKRNTSDTFKNRSQIAKVLQMRKVLLVLDNIDDEQQLDTLLVTKAFHKESKIIITTRDQNIANWFNSISSRCKVHELESLNENESVELLSRHAFPNKILVNGFEEPAKQLTQYCGGNPLAIKILGRSLSVRDVADPYKRNRMIEIWRKKMNSLNSLKGDIDGRIQEVLRTSYDSLPYESDKQLFLHVACFFVGQYKEQVVSILEDDLDAQLGINTLVNRCLLSISHSGELAMHQLLQEMGRKIVCDENRYPENRSRVWDDNDSYNVLKAGKGSDTIQGLLLDIKKIKQYEDKEIIDLQTSSIAMMDKLKILQLKGVQLTGLYDNFPRLRWLVWRGCSLKTIVDGLLTSNLVVLDMSGGHLEKFEVPTVLNSLKTLKLENCEELVSICNLNLLPNLEELRLSGCQSLTHLCESIGDLKSLAYLCLIFCVKLFKASSNNNGVESSPKRPRIDVDTSEQPLFILPCSLVLLDFGWCELEYSSDFRVAFHAGSYLGLNLEGNFFKSLPSSIDLRMIHTLDLSSNHYLKSLPCIPCTLMVLNIDWCWSLDRIRFESGRYSLREFSYEGCSSLCEVEGLFKLVPIAEIDEVDLGHMQWLKAYEDHEVELVGDVITKGQKYWRIQMLHEYGIRSTYLQGIKDQSSVAYKETSSSAFVSLQVPEYHNKNKIQGLHVSCLYRSSGPMGKNMRVLLAKINITTKGLTWVYNPVVYYKPSDDDDVLWLCYWPIGHLLDACDEVNVEIIVDEEMIVCECSVGLVYMNVELEEEENSESDKMEEKEVGGGDPSESEEENNRESNTIEEEEEVNIREDISEFEDEEMEDEVIGGDLSEFNVINGGYYLGRRDLFGSETLCKLKVLFGGNVDHPETQGWKNTRQYPELPQEPVYQIQMELGVDVNNESEIDKIKKAVSSLASVKSANITCQGNEAFLVVYGHFNPAEMEDYVQKFDAKAFIITVDFCF